MIAFYDGNGLEVIRQDGTGRAPGDGKDTYPRCASPPPGGKHTSRSGGQRQGTFGVGDRSTVDRTHGAFGSVWTPKRRLAMRNYLVVANQTLAGEHLIEEVARRTSSGPSMFHVVVPAAPNREQVTWSEGRRLPSPSSGSTLPFKRSGRSGSRWTAKSVMETPCWPSPTRGRTVPWSRSSCRRYRPACRAGWPSTSRARCALASTSPSRT